MTRTLPRRTHEVELIHNWGPPATLPWHGTYVQSVKTCRDCGRERRTFHLYTDENPEDNGRLGDQENEQAERNAIASIRELGNSLEQYIEDLLRDTGFNDLA